MRRARGQIAPLIAAPKQQDLLHLRSAPEQRAVVAVGGKEHVLHAHRTGDADRDALLAERDGIGPEPPRALQRNGPVYRVDLRPVPGRVTTEFRGLGRRT